MNTPVRRVDYLAVAGAAVLFVWVRVPLYTAPGVTLGWNSDSAIFGLIAREMASTGRVIWFFWGQDYLGTITSMIAVAVGAIAGGGVGPLALRVAVGAELLIGLILFWDALRITWGRAVANLSLFWLVLGPVYFFKLSYAPNAEQMFLLGALIFWYVVRYPFTTVGHWAVLGVLSGIAWWAHRGAVMVVPAAMLVALFYDDEWRRRPTRTIVALLMFAIGASICVVPFVLGRLHEGQPLYAPLAAQWSISTVMSRIFQTLTTDLWQFLGGGVAALLLLPLAVLGLPGLTRRRNDVFAIGAGLTCGAFWIFSTITYSGALRYLILALPIVFALAARGIVRMPFKIAAAVMAMVIGAAFAAGRFAEVRRIASGQGEQHEHWPGGFDPRPAVMQIRAGSYEACYADFWLAYKLEWLSGVPFIPYKSVDRTQLRSLRLASSSGDKCFVDSDGNVARLTERQSELFRAETVAHWHRRTR